MVFAVSAIALFGRVELSVVTVTVSVPTDTSDDAVTVIEPAVAELTVTVHKERFSSPDRQFNSSGAAYQLFGTALPSTAGAESVAGDGVRWEDMGRDPAMEAYLLRRINEFNGAASQRVASGS